MTLLETLRAVLMLPAWGLAFLALGIVLGQRTLIDAGDEPRADAISRGLGLVSLPLVLLCVALALIHLPVFS